MRRLLLLLALIPTAIEMAESTMCLNTKPAQKIDTAQEKCLAVTIYGEARGESQKGKIAVAYTVLNRAVNKSLCQVALAPKQYSIFNNNPKLRAAAVSLHLFPDQKNVIDERSWKESMEVAQVVMRKYIPDPTNGATHYLAPLLMTSKHYAYPKWSRQYKLVAVIEGHRFYKAG